MKNLSEIINLQNQSGQQQQSNTSQNTPHSQEDKNKLAITLALVCALQQQYGKTDKELELIVEGFSRVLRNYSMDRIIDAIEKYTLKNPNIPAPADIENLINPPLPKIEWPAYITLKKKQIDRNYNYYLTPEEKQFMRDCENLAILKQKGELENYNNAQMQIESHKNLAIANDF